MQTKSTLARAEDVLRHQRVLSEELAGDGGVVRRHAGGARRRRWRSPSAATSAIELGKQLIPRFDCPDGKDEQGYLRELVLEGLRERYGDPPPAEAIERMEMELGVIDTMGFNAYFLIVWDFVDYAKSNGIAVGPGRGSRRRQPRRLLPADHGRRPAALRPAVRALPQRRARVDAGHRHRLLRARPRARDPLRDREVRRRAGRADHHLRQDVPARRHARRRARARPRVRDRRQAREADPGPAAGPPAELRGLPAAGRRPRRRGRARPGRQADRRRRAGPGGHRPQRVDPRRGGRDRRPAADRHRPAAARRRRHGRERRRRSTARSPSTR